MPKKLFIITAILAGLALFTASQGCARKAPPRSEDKIGRLIDKLSDSLNLSKEQKTAVEQLKKEITEKNEQSRNERKDEGRQIDEVFKSEILKDKIDPVKINKVLDAASEKRESLRRFMVLELAKFHALLTAEQKEKLAGLMKELAPEPNKEGGPKPAAKQGPAR